MLTADEILRLSRPQKPAEATKDSGPAEAWEPPVGVSRAEYWREYHLWRQANDPAYRARKIAAALRHKAKRVDAAGGQV